MAGIFVSYRRNDSGGYAGRLFAALRRAFGPHLVFMDIDTLQPGWDFGRALDQAVGECDVLLALIGPHWLTITDASGQRRLDGPDDYVRLEIATALQRDVPVIPVLVGDAPMPQAAALPEPLQALARRHAFELSDERWDYDVARLVGRLKPVVKHGRGLVIGRFMPGAIAAVALVGALLAALIGIGDPWDFDSADPTATPSQLSGAPLDTPTATPAAIATVPPSPTSTRAAPSATATQQLPTPTPTATLRPTKEPPPTRPPRPTATPRPTRTAIEQPANSYTNPTRAYTLSWEPPWQTIDDANFEIALHNRTSIVGFRAVPASAYAGDVVICARTFGQDLAAHSFSAGYVGETAANGAYFVTYQYQAVNSSLWGPGPTPAEFLVRCAPLSSGVFVISVWFVPQVAYATQLPLVNALVVQVVPIDTRADAAQRSLRGLTLSWGH